MQGCCQCQPRSFNWTPSQERSSPLSPGAVGTKLLSGLRFPCRTNRRSPRRCACAPVPRQRHTPPHARVRRRCCWLPALCSSSVRVSSPTCSSFAMPVNRTGRRRAGWTRCAHGWSVTSRANPPQSNQQHQGAGAVLSINVLASVGWPTGWLWALLTLWIAWFPWSSSLCRTLPLHECDGVPALRPRADA
jgi:hypothetical protein